MTTTITDIHEHNSITCTTFLTSTEIDHIVSMLTAVTSVEEVSSDDFLTTYAVHLERCSIQAHTDAAANAEEYVLESIVLHDKVTVLVQTLLAVEAWREFVLPHILTCFDQSSSLDVSSSSSSKTVDHKHERHAVSILRVAFTLHVETTLVGLLNLILYKYKCNEVGLDKSEYGIAVVDYCARRMVALAASPLDINEMVRRQKDPQYKLECTMKDDFSSADEIKNTCLESDFQTCIAATALARYLTEHIEDTTVSIQTRILDTHDFIMLMIPLIEEPPWTRRREKKVLSKASPDNKTHTRTVWEKFIDNEWKEVLSKDLLKVTKYEAQCWFTIYFLTCSKSCRECYGLNNFRKEQILRLRKYLNEVMTDQLPILSEVMRYMDELAMMNVPANATGHGAALMMQEVCSLRDSLLENRASWEIVAHAHFEYLLSRSKAKTDSVLKQISNIYSDDQIEQIIDNPPTELITREIDYVDVSIDMKDTGKSDTINFHYITPSERGIAMNTPKGMYRRYKLDDPTNIEPSSYFLNPSEHLTIHVEVSFKNIDSSHLKLNGEFSLQAPYVVDITNDENDTNKNSETIISSGKNEWRQIGSLDNELILQICFQRKSSRYQVLSVFLSLPEKN